jgi:hypothetical protein
LDIKVDGKVKDDLLILLNKNNMDYYYDCGCSFNIIVHKITLKICTKHIKEILNMGNN